MTRRATVTVTVIAAVLVLRHLGRVRPEDLAATAAHRDDLAHQRAIHDTTRVDGWLAT